MRIVKELCEIHEYTGNENDLSEELTKELEENFFYGKFSCCCDCDEKNIEPYIEEFERFINDNFTLTCDIPSPNLVDEKKEAYEVVLRMRPEYSKEEMKMVVGDIPITAQFLREIIKDELAYLQFLDTSNITSFHELFYGEYLDNINYEQLENWDTSNVKDMSRMFAFRYELYYLKINKWDVSNVTNFEDMFLESHGTHQKYMNLSNWQIDEKYIYECDELLTGCYTNTQLIVELFTPTVKGRESELKKVIKLMIKILEEQRYRSIKGEDAAATPFFLEKIKAIKENIN